MLGSVVAVSQGPIISRLLAPLVSNTGVAESNG